MPEFAHRTRVVALVVTALGVACGTTAVAPAATDDRPAGVAETAQQPGPFDDTFYAPPRTMPAGEPGDVIRWRPALPAMNLANANGWQVMYLSTNALGERDAVTATVLVPKNADPAMTPIVGYAPGTQGPAFKCAASKAIERGTLYDQPAINDLISRGYAVAVTDYEGYSPETTPTYITGRSEGPAVIDAVRAAQRFPQADLEPDAQVAFQGYSQGGGAVMWAGQQQPTYAPELNLVGVAGGGVPADLNEVAEGLDGYVGFGFLAFAAVGLDAAYPELNLDSYLNEAGEKAISEAKQQDCVVELLAKYPGKKISDYTTHDPLPTPRWQARIEENRLGATAIQVPVFQYHASADEIVNLPQADALHRRYCELGVPVTWKTYVSDHLSGIFAGNADAGQFLADQFEGKPTDPSC